MSNPGLLLLAAVCVASLLGAANSTCCEAWLPLSPECTVPVKLAGYSCDANYPNGWCAYDVAAGDLLDGLCCDAAPKSYSLDKATGRCVPPPTTQRATTTTTSSEPGSSPFAGLGLAYSLYKLDLTQPSKWVGGADGNTIMDLPVSCYGSSPNNNVADYDLQVYSTTAEFASSVGNGVSVSVGAEVAGFTASASVSTTFGSSVGTTSSYSSASLNAKNIVTTYTVKPECLEDEALYSQQFLADFMSLSTEMKATASGVDGSANSVTSSTTWPEYTRFLEQYGSHMVSTVYAGARLQIWAVQTSDGDTSSEDCSTAVCAGVGAFGVEVEGCVSQSSSSDSAATNSAVQVSAHTYGGDATAAARLISGSSNVQDDTEESAILAFLNSASADTAADYGYSTIWDALRNLYTSFSDPENYMRTVILQAAYEKYLADFTNEQVTTECWFPHLFNPNNAVLDHDSDAGTVAECQALCNSADFATCANWEVRPVSQEEHDSPGCYLKTANGQLAVKSYSTWGFKDACGTKEASGFEILASKAGSVDLEFELLPCTHPIADQDECERCGNVWTTVQVTDYEYGTEHDDSCDSSCSWFTCKDTNCVENPDTYESTFDFSFCCSPDMDMALVPEGARTSGSDTNK